MSLIRIDHVTKLYRRSHLGKTKETVGVRDLTFALNAGEVFGLLGLNGAGKTTALKLILGLLRPTQGTIHVGERLMPDRVALARIGYLPEAAYLNRTLTGREALHFFATLSGLAPGTRAGRVNGMLEKVGMTKMADRPIGGYSKGMLQRITIAQSLLHDPDILILDEPLTGLDPLAVKETRSLITWLKSEKKTVLVSSHDISEVERVCDRIAILSEGRMVELMERARWDGKHNELEEIFVKAAASAGSVAPLQFGGAA